MNIDGINTGYVLDHIKAGKGFELYHLLGLDKADCTVAIIQRANSEKYGMKDIIKIDADIPIDYDLIRWKEAYLRSSGSSIRTRAATDACTVTRCIVRTKNEILIYTADIHTCHISWQDHGVL